MKIIIDPKRFSQVSEMWRLRLTGMSIREILFIVNNEWGLRTPRRGKQGGSPICHSHIYKLFSDPFYAGIMKRAEGSFPGTHPPMISWAEFEQAQALFHKISSRPKSHWFTYRGLLRCGACGNHVTAKYTFNHQNKKYVHYHCGRKQRPSRYCPQPCIEEKKIERQICHFLKNLIVPTRLLAWGLDRTTRLNKNIQAAEEESTTQVQHLLRRKELQLARLLMLHVDEVIDMGEYTEQKSRLQTEADVLREQLVERENKSLIPGDCQTDQLTLLSIFEGGSPEMRREFMNVLFVVTPH